MLRQKFRRLVSLITLFAFSFSQLCPSIAYGGRLYFEIEEIHNLNPNVVKNTQLKIWEDDGTKKLVIYESPIKFNTYKKNNIVEIPYIKPLFAKPGFGNTREVNLKHFGTHLQITHNDVVSKSAINFTVDMDGRIEIKELGSPNQSVSIKTFGDIYVKCAEKKTEKPIALNAKDLCLLGSNIFTNTPIKVQEKLELSPTQTWFNRSHLEAGELINHGTLNLGLIRFSDIPWLITDIPVNQEHSIVTKKLTNLGIIQSAMNLIYDIKDLPGNVKAERNLNFTKRYQQEYSPQFRQILENLDIAGELYLFLSYFHVDKDLTLYNINHLILESDNINVSADVNYMIPTTIQSNGTIDLYGATTSIQGSQIIARSKEGLKIIAQNSIDFPDEQKKQCYEPYFRKGKRGKIERITPYQYVSIPTTFPSPHEIKTLSGSATGVRPILISQEPDISPAILRLPLQEYPLKSGNEIDCIRKAQSKKRQRWARVAGTVAGIAATYLTGGLTSAFAAKAASSAVMHKGNMRHVRKDLTSKSSIRQMLASTVQTAVLGGAPVNTSSMDSLIGTMATRTAHGAIGGAISAGIQKKKIGKGALIGSVEAATSGLASVAAENIGDMHAQKIIDRPTQIALHGVSAGGIRVVENLLLSKNPMDGVVASSGGAMLGEGLVPILPFDHGFNVIATKILIASVAASTGQDPDIAVSSAANAIENNLYKHFDPFTYAGAEIEIGPRGSVGGGGVVCNRTISNAPRSGSTTNLSRNIKGLDLASGFKGNKGFELKNPSFQKIRNESTIIGNREFSGHALDQMQNRGIMPTVIENVLKTGKEFPTRLGTKGFYDDINNIMVITNPMSGKIVTVIHASKK